MSKAKVVRRYVHVENPETRENVVLKPGDELPEWATDIVTNPRVFEKPEDQEDEVNNGPSMVVLEGTEAVLDGAQVETDPREDEDVNESGNANPMQHPTAGQPGENQLTEDDAAEGDDEAPTKVPAKKAAAKRAPAKKAAAKRAPAKKAAAKRAPAKKAPAKKP